MIGIVVDTNILAMSPYLTRDEWNTLATHMADWHVRIFIPEVVLVETVNVVQRRWTEQREKFAGAKIADLGIQDEVDAVSSRIQERIDSYEESLRSKLSKVGAEIIPIPEISHMEIARRASDRRAPYQGKSKDGYRDTLIWLTVLDLAPGSPTDEIWFVSDNHQDFGTNGTTIVEGVESPARTLHQDLRDELDALGLRGVVRYTASLAALVQHLASIHLPISEQDLEALISDVDRNGLQSLLMAKGIMVADPIDVALTPELTGVVADQFLPTGSWEFSDAATRGTDHWTANYSVEAVARIEGSMGMRLDRSIAVSKPVLVSGTVTFSNDGQPTDLRVSNIDALPDDPYLRLFELAQSLGFGANDVGWVMDPEVHAAREEMAVAASGLAVSDLEKMLAGLKKPSKKKKNGRSRKPRSPVPPRN
ncbi:DUF4935 domain-containing protein [Arthrobacter sp. BHU FT2]|nr:DUF4935 domain-containing protein [Arthrobacter sp. BHU FT2]